MLDQNPPYETTDEAQMLLHVDEEPDSKKNGKAEGERSKLCVEGSEEG